MLGIAEIGRYIPNVRVSNVEKLAKFELDEDFLKNKLGVLSQSIKDEDEKTSDLCVKAFYDLEQKTEINKEDIECCIVVTQNPDYNIPHTSAIVHGKLALEESCACFDISLGCSGYVYGLSTIIAFMQNNGMKKGLLFTADPYSEIIDHDDKNTDLLFGDAATVTLISTEALYKPVDFSFGTKGKEYQQLLCDKKLYMNGRAVFNFTATVVPKHIQNLMQKNNLSDDQIGRYILHQGSRFIVDTITKRLKIAQEKVPFNMLEYGNTVSSSIPLILAEEMKSEHSYMLLSGYGVGLSWASTILQKVEGK